jgi:hypothetical protein
MSTPPSHSNPSKLAASDPLRVPAMTDSRSTSTPLPSAEWPALPLDAWKDTYATLHMWTQIVGKTRLALTPLVNHWWNVPLYVNARGLTTSLMRAEHCEFEISFDFIDHQLRIHTADDRTQQIALKPRTVADFYREFRGTLVALGINVKLWPMPVEIPDPIRFDQDTAHSAYDPEYANRFWRILANLDAVFSQFRAGFIGKSSPVHFFWGSFDFCFTRFSGRRAPERPGADPITREAYSRSHQRWLLAGSGEITEPAFCTPHRHLKLRRGAVRPASALRQGLKRVHPYVRRYANRPKPCRVPDGISTKHLRRRRQPGKLGAQGIGKRTPVGPYRSGRCLRKWHGIERYENKLVQEGRQPSRDTAILTGWIHTRGWWYATGTFDFCFFRLSSRPVLTCGSRAGCACCARRRCLHKLSPKEKKKRDKKDRQGIGAGRAAG